MSPTPLQIALALDDANVSRNVEANWPTIEDDLGPVSTLATIAALATIRVECPPFAPESERYNGNPADYFKRYDGRADLGNTQPGDGYRFRGRGYVQITGRANYAMFGAAVGVDLIATPDKALDPDTAARIFAAFFHSRGIAQLADEQDWLRVRSRVNGGLNGFELFKTYVGRLKLLYGQK